MDKFEKILDVIDHQEKYSDEEIREILQDEESRKFYQTMQEVDSALLKKESHNVDVESEWEKFSEEHALSEKVNVVPMPRFSWRKIAVVVAVFVLVSGIAIAAIHTYIRKSHEPMVIAQNTEGVIHDDSSKNDTAKVVSTEEVRKGKPAVHKTFVNVALGKMLTEIAVYYDLQVVFGSDEAKNLRLYYEWDSHTKLEDVVKELNQFENVNITLNGHVITVQ